MSIAKSVRLAGTAVVAVFVFFDVTFPFDVALSTAIEIPDPAIEAGYTHCYQEKDKAMHQAVFSTVDNPDVQKEMIITNRKRIARECRELVPEQVVTVQEPWRFNLIDLKPRFW